MCLALRRHLRLHLNSNLCLNLSSELYMELNREEFEKLFQKMFRKFFASSFGLLFDLKYQQSWLSLYLVLHRQMLLRGRSPGRPLPGRIVSGTAPTTICRLSASHASAASAHRPVRRGHIRDAPATSLRGRVPFSNDRSLFPARCSDRGLARYPGDNGADCSADCGQSYGGGSGPSYLTGCGTGKPVCNLTC